MENESEREGKEWRKEIRGEKRMGECGMNEVELLELYIVGV